MSSSTSSSSSPPAVAEVAAANVGDRRIFLKILLAITLGMAASLALVRWVAYLNDARAETILARVVEARAALPRIVAEEDDLVLMFGSSMTEVGYSARQFDRQMAERGVRVKSFNFGFGGLNPYFQDYLARRVREQFEQSDRRLKLAVIEFVPFQLTTSRWNGAQSLVDSFVSMLATPAEMWDITLEDPTRGVRMFNIHYLRNDISAEMITAHFGEVLLPPPPQSDLPEDDEAVQARLQTIGEQLNAKFAEEYPDYENEAWNYAWQGAGTIPEERSAETLALFPPYYEALQTPRRLDQDRLQRIQCCDIEELRFEPELVEAFIRIVQIFQQFSDHVEVVVMPKNSAWIHNPPEALERMARVLERIRQETGVPIRDLQDLESITPQMYSDTTHLARYSGDVAYTAHLVDMYAPLLGGTEPQSEENE